MSMQDTSSLDALAADVNEAARVSLINPRTYQPLVDENGVQAYIDVLSRDSDVARAVTRKALDRRLKGRRPKITAEDVEAETVALLVAVTTDWHLVDPNGRRVDAECNDANKKALYSNPKFAWLRVQVEEVMGDEAAFLKG